MNNKIAALIIVVIVVSIVSGIGVYQLMSGTVSSGIAEESLQIIDLGIWLSIDPSYCQAAVLMINERNVAATIQKITIRGIECSWSDVYYWEGEIGSVSCFSPPSSDLTGNPVAITVDGKELSFQKATSMIELDAYKAIALYIKNAGNISSQDMPKGNITIAIFTAKSAYLEEASLDVGSIGFMGTEELKITRLSFYGAEIAITANNTGTTSVTINELRINNAVQSFTPQTVEANNGIIITVTYPWEAGYNYQVKLVSSKGNTFTYTGCAPS